MQALPDCSILKKICNFDVSTVFFFFLPYNQPLTTHHFQKDFPSRSVFSLPEISRQNKKVFYSLCSTSIITSFPLGHANSFPLLMYFSCSGDIHYLLSHRKWSFSCTHFLTQSYEIIFQPIIREDL